jgi:histidinol-phosphate/aromatic aminotransferase/cobyric acid decarboxylase-like protein/choline kinase
MQAVILAAGYGSRMRPLTDKTHKTLLTIGDKTIIGRLVDALIENGIRRIIVVTGYLADRLQGFLRQQYPDVEFTFVHNERYQETNNICSLSMVINTVPIDEDLILIESDMICDSSVIRRIVETPHANVALLDRFRSGMDGTVVTVQDGVVTSVILPHLQGPNFDFSDKYKTLNIYRFSRAFCNSSFKTLLDYYTRVMDDNCYYELILGILIYVKKEIIHAEIIDGERWAEVDDPNDLREAELVFNKERRLDILERSCGGFWNHDILDFCYLRNMYFPPPSLLSELKNLLPKLVQQYGSSQEVLDLKLSYFLLCQPERALLLNGAAQAFPILQRLRGNAPLLRPEPTFGEYRRCFPDADVYDDHFEVRPQDIESRAKPGGWVVFVNPNNPTGTLLDSAWIHDFAARRKDLTVLVDESFIDFAETVSMVGLLEQRPLDNVVVLKSLSKCLGVPGLRLGFVYTANPALLAELRAAVPIWNINSMAEFFLDHLLKYRPEVARSFAQTAADRRAFREELARLRGVTRVIEGAANFVVAELDSSAGSMVELSRALLAQHNIYVKDISARFADSKPRLRLAVRSRTDHQLLIAALAEMLRTPASLQLPPLAPQAIG